MDRRRLAERLRTLRTDREIDRSQAPLSRSDTVEETNRLVERLTGRGWTRLHRLTYRRETVSSVDFSAATAAAEAATELFLLSPGSGPELLAFMDIETTGLSGGAGNPAFLVGVGRLREGRLWIEQFFLADFPGEPEFLGCLNSVLDENLVFVTYNGKSFDTNILKTRFLMSGMRKEFPRQIDLLYPARRLWKRVLASCSLGTVEKRVLGIGRELDVPGSLIPDIYFEYLRSGDPDLLEPVFHHHLYDIETLARLLFHMESIFARPDLAGFVDESAFGEMLLQRGRPAGETVLASAFERGNRRAGKHLSIHLKRTGRIGEAVSIWRAMYSAGPDLFAGIELAKYTEHRLKRYPEAIDIVSNLLSMPHSPVIRGELRHRLERLRTKLSASGAVKPSR